MKFQSMLLMKNSWIFFTAAQIKGIAMFKATVEFSNGTAITDKFSDKDDFNLWVKNAVADFGNIVYIKIL